MSTPSIYDDGLITVTQGSTAFTGISTAFSTQIKHGSQLNIGGIVMTVDTVTDDFNGTFVKPWPGESSSGGVEYHILTWTDGGEIAEYVRILMERLIGKGLGVVSEGVPSPENYQSNDLIWNRLTGTLYIKDQGLLHALIAPARYDAAGYTNLSPNDRDVYDDGQGNLENYVGTGLTFFSINEAGFYILMVPAGEFGSPPAIWSDLIQIVGPAGSANVTATSDTVITLGTGSKSFTINETNRQWVNGTRLRVASAANPSTQWMEGVVTAYSVSALTLMVDKVFGIGPASSWTIGIAGEPSNVPGADGTDPGILYNFSDNNTPGADPGEVRADNSDLTLATSLYFSQVDRGNNDVAAFLSEVGDSTSASKGYVNFRRPGGNGQAIFKITAASVPETGYTTVPVEHVSGADSFVDESVLSIEFHQRGDAGSGANAFTDLEDAPANYSGAAGKIVRVNSGGNGLEYGPVLGDAAPLNVGTGAGTVAAGNDTRITSAIHSATAGEINAITVKTTPVGDDKIIIEDSQASWAKKSTTVGNLLGLWDAIEFVIDGGFGPITTGVKGDLLIPFGCAIGSATLLADQTGSIIVDIWKLGYGSYPPTVSDSIVGSAPLTISAGIKSQDTTLTGWTTGISAGDVLRFNVNSNATITRVTVALIVKKTS